MEKLKCDRRDRSGQHKESSLPPLLPGSHLRGSERQRPVKVGLFRPLAAVSPLNCRPPAPIAAHPGHRSGS